MAEHTVNITITKGKKFGYDNHCIHVCGGDKIKWTLKKGQNDLPFAILIKALESPLSWDAARTTKGKRTIAATVRKDARPGYYPYGVCAFDGDEPLVDDPEIIVRRP